MSELQNRLLALLLRLDYMGMRCEQAVCDALVALAKGNVEAGLEVARHDETIDCEEVEIDRLLALYQPAAIDLRTLCTIIKINNDLERIADLAAKIGLNVVHFVAAKLSKEDQAQFDTLTRNTKDVLGRTIRLLNTKNVESAHKVIDADETIDDGHKQLVTSILSAENQTYDAAAAMSVLNLAKALERIGDLCTNIAEDIIFLGTGDIVRHQGALDK